VDASATLNHVSLFKREKVYILKIIFLIVKVTSISATVVRIAQLGCPFREIFHDLKFLL